MRGGSGGRWVWVLPPLLLISAAVLLARGGSRPLPGTTTAERDASAHAAHTYAPSEPVRRASSDEPERRHGMGETRAHPSEARPEAGPLPIVLREGDTCGRALAALRRCLERHRSLTSVALVDTAQGGGRTYRVRWEYDIRRHHLAYLEEDQEAATATSWCCDVSEDAFLALGAPATGEAADPPALHWRVCRHGPARAP